MSLIILEGQDGCGKTTLGKQLAETYNLPMHPSRGPNRTRTEFNSNIVKDAALSSGILDRLTPISDWVYKRAARKTPFHHPEETVKFLTWYPAILVFCQSDNPTPSTKPKTHKTAEDLETAIRNAARIKSSYTILKNYLRANNIRIIEYDWRKNSFGDLLNEIERQNDNLEFPQSLRRDTPS